MGFNKRIINKSNIIFNIKNLGFIIKMTNADALILDIWSSSFYDNLDFDWVKYQSKRDEIVSNNSLNSSNNFGDEDLKPLMKLSNIYCNLLNSPTWLDISLSESIIGRVDSNISGDFEELVKYYIDKINSKFENEY